MEDRSDSEDAGTPVEAAGALAALREAWPRTLIEDGLAAPLAEWWLAARRAAIELGRPPFPRHPLGPAVAQALFEARRARRLERGLEAAEQRLASEEAGQAGARAAETDATARISRLLVVSADAAPRFYRRAERLRERHAQRLEVLLLEADEDALGAAVFGRGRRARALLLDHKDAVVRLLRVLELAAPAVGTQPRDEAGQPEQARPVDGSGATGEACDRVSRGSGILQED